jgi:GNAT superfamily N-acetyltransferase
MEWKLVARPGVAALERFLSDQEPAAVAVSERIRRGYLDKRLRSGGRVYLIPGEAAVYHGPGGFFSPLGLAQILPENRRARLSTELKKITGSFPRLHSIMGPAEDVGLLESVFPSEIRHRINYELLALPWQSFPPKEAPPDPELQVFYPRLSNWRRLLPLQIAYEIEEVLLPGRRANPSTSRANLTHSLNTQIVLAATYRGTVVARVATNARGYRGDQVGGVYTDPAWRGRGVARWLMTHLLAELRQHERNASLFVKLDNRPAQELYRSLGFAFVSDFRISYYH